MTDDAPPVLHPDPGPRAEGGDYAGRGARVVTGAGSGTRLYRAEQRQRDELGWIDIRSPFDRQAPDPLAARFGSLLAFDNGLFAPGRNGFGLHPHRNLEVMSFVAGGRLDHTDDAGHHTTLAAGDFQLFSSGAQMWHSEYNASASTGADMFQIWILPREPGGHPHYDWTSTRALERDGAFVPFAAPDGRAPLQIRQDAWLSIGRIGADGHAELAVHRPDVNGVWLIVLDGTAHLGETTLEARDAAGLVDDDGAPFDGVHLTGTPGTRLIAVEVPIDRH